MPRGSGDGYGGDGLDVKGLGSLPDNKFYMFEVPGTVRHWERGTQDYRQGNRLLATQQGLYSFATSITPVASSGVHTRSNRREPGVKLAITPVDPIYLEDNNNVF